MGGLLAPETKPIPRQTWRQQGRPKGSGWGEEGSSQCWEMGRLPGDGQLRAVKFGNPSAAVAQNVFLLSSCRCSKSQPSHCPASKGRSQDNDFHCPMGQGAA